MSNLNALKKELQNAGNPQRAKTSMRFFKTEKGSYGHGDIFVGITVPDQRIIAKQYSGLTLKNIAGLLASKIHEYRLVALLILIDQYKKANKADKKKIFQFYLAHIDGVNNWDLVDLSAPYIPGAYLSNKNKSILFKLAKSWHIWHKRIAMISTLAFIRNNQFDDTLKIAEILLRDEHDLIHKAVGWMLREVGKRSMATEEKFLKKHYKNMPRTALRYAIERMPRQKRLFYLK
jgi:3-methyladenine DNA glycosylase AlkD